MEQEWAAYNFNYPLCEICQNTEFLLVRIFPHLGWIRRDTKHLSVFSPNAGKYGPEKNPYLDTFHAVFDGHENKLRSGYRTVIRILMTNIADDVPSISGFLV